MIKILTGHQTGAMTKTVWAPVTT